MCYYFVMPALDQETYALLRLTLVKGLGPVLIGRLIQAFGSAERSLGATAGMLQNVRGIGKERAAKVRSEVDRSDGLAASELEEAARIGARVIGIQEAEYPVLLRQIPDPPPVLYVRGRMEPEGRDRYAVGIVGSRACTHYGREQAERFSMQLAQSGLVIVSGGARGIDTCAHRAALRVKGRTLAVMGCGLSNVYPPENAGLFDQIAGDEGIGEAGNGAIISELPMRAAPTSENFPGRNRIISGISLGVIVVEAGLKSGALITAKQAVEEHGREVFGIPGRVDSGASEGVLELLKQGGAAMVTQPKDVLDAIESAARHQFAGTHDAITRDPSREDQGEFDWRSMTPREEAKPSEEQDRVPRDEGGVPGLSVRQRAIVEALEEPRTIDELIAAVGGDPAKVRAEITMLEIKRQVVRAGSRLVRAPKPG